VRERGLLLDGLQNQLAGGASGLFSLPRQLDEKVFFVLGYVDIQQHIALSTKAHYMERTPLRSFINFIDDWAAAQLRFLHLEGCLPVTSIMSPFQRLGLCDRSCAAAQIAMKLR
jgi:hypothetical protein